MHVLIIGAGLGGVMLASLLEKAKVSYLVLERASEVKPLGSAMGISVNILTVFRQLGIYIDIAANSQPVYKATQHTYPPSKPQVDFYGYREERYGENDRVITRPKLYATMLKMVPKDKILFDKNVTALQQTDGGATVQCDDNTSFHCDVLVGADGAYSTIRGLLYKQLQEKKMLPAEDAADLPFNCTCLVGVTRPLSEGTIESPKDECRVEGIEYKELPYAGAFFTQPDGSVCWSVLQHTGNFTSRGKTEDANIDWGPNAAKEMCDKVKDLPTPFGHSLGFFIDNTPKEGISKVMLEEKMFLTWHHGRVVLLGDACHKMFPAAGQGATNAMQDAIVLANVLEACPTTNIEEVSKCLQAYYEERFPPAKISYDTSSRFAAFFKKGMKGDILRFVMKILPRRLIAKQLDVLYYHRPQAAFLPFIPPKGTIPPAPQTNYNFLRTPATASTV